MRVLWTDAMHTVVPWTRHAVLWTDAAAHCCDVVVAVVAATILLLLFALSVSFETSSFFFSLLLLLLLILGYVNSLFKTDVYVFVYVSDMTQPVTVRVRVCFRYDTTSYFSGRFQPQDSASVLQSRKAVCQGYAELFLSLCKSVNLCFVRATLCKSVNLYFVRATLCS